MTIPFTESFENITGTLGSGSATIDGLTFFNTDPTAVLTVSAPAGLALTGNLLSLGGSSTASPTVAGFKTADGSAFSLITMDFYGPFNSELTLDGFRDGVLVDSRTSTTPAFPAIGGFGSQFTNIDEFRLTGSDNSPILIDELVLAAPVVTHFAPTITISGDSPTYQEGAAPVFIDRAQTAVISDPDTFVFNGGSLSVAVTTNAVPAEDVLGILTGSGVSLSGSLANGATVFVGTTAIGTVSSDGSHGNPLTIDFNANANSANVTTLFHAMTYADSNPDDPNITPRVLEVSFSDGDGQTAITLFAAVVNRVNDAPVAVASAGSASYTEGTPVRVDGGITLSDVDSANLAGATVKITGNYKSGDVLLFIAQHGITGVFDAPSGTLTLTGSASVANYQSALESINFFTDHDPGSLTRTVTFTVNDGALDSAPVTRTVNVTPLDDAPDATSFSAPVAFVENGAPVAIEPALVLLDPDNTTFAFAGVRFSSGFHAGQDVLGFTSSGGITGTYDAAIGELLLAGIASLSAYQAVLRSVTYSNTSENPDTTTRGLIFDASDGIVRRDIVTNQVTVNSVNDAPALAGVAASVAFGQHGAVTLSPGLTVSDVDSATLAGASVHITGGTFAGDGDVLAAVTAGTGISANYNAATETLTLSGTDTLAHYAQVLDTVTFQSTSVDATGAGAHPTRTVEWQLDDGAASNNHSAVATTTIAISHHAATNDLNGNGTSNILWQNADGTAAAWSVNGLTLQSGANIGINLGAAWHEIGSGDFNGDGKSDILWQNTDGTPAVWLTNGTNAPTVAAIGFNPGPSWHEVATGDFNGDGKADILWQNQNGQAAVWLMNGTNLLQGSDVGFNPGASWHVIGTGDFDGDGKADILWQNSNGQAAVWLMDGLNLKSGANVGFNPGSAWQVQAAADFNGDGKADILWQNKDGTPAIWLMNGTSLISGANVGFNPGSAWQVHGAADFNGDGKADIIWQNTDGTPAVWLMDGTSLISGANVGFNPGAAWHVTPLHHDLV
jgi:FG-GAP-like repeat/Bacterial cadherin-like domain/FG-GAP repeat